jgi:uncharacterized OB-fold protein
MTGFPAPRPDADTQLFWDAVARRRLLVPRCRECGFWIWQPKPVCPRCQALDPEWQPVTGEGRVASWTVIRPPVLPGLAELVPFVIVLVELDEGVRLLGQLVDDEGRLLQTDGAAEGLHMGSRVSLRWRRQDDITLPAWTLPG